MFFNPQPLRVLLPALHQSCSGQGHLDTHFHKASNHLPIPLSLNHAEVPSCLPEMLHSPGFHDITCSHFSPPICPPRQNPKPQAEVIELRVSSVPSWIFCLQSVISPEERISFHHFTYVYWGWWLSQLHLQPQLSLWTRLRNSTLFQRARTVFTRELLMLPPAPKWCIQHSPPPQQRLGSPHLSSIPHFSPSLLSHLQSISKSWQLSLQHVSGICPLLYVSITSLSHVLFSVRLLQ